MLLRSKKLISSLVIFTLGTSAMCTSEPEKEDISAIFGRKFLAAHNPLIPASLQTFLTCVENINSFSSYDELLAAYSQLSSLKQRATSHTSKKDEETMYDQAELLVVATLCKKQAHGLISNLINVLAELFDQLTYWQQVKLRPFNYYMTHSPTKMISKKACLQLADRAVDSLKEAIYYYSYYLGHLYQNVHALENLKTDTEIKNNLGQTATLIKACVNHQSLDHAMTSPAAILEIHDMLTACHQAATQFSTHSLPALHQFAKPTHMERNWWRYSFAAGTLAACAVYWYLNHDALMENMRSAAGGIKKLFTENLVQPISNVVQEYTSKPQSANNQLKEYLKTQEEQLIDILNNFLEEKAKKQNISAVQLQDEIKKMIRTGDYAMVKDDIKEFLNRPAYALNPYGKTSPVSAIWLLQSVHAAAKVISSIEDRVNQQQVNLQLLLTIPASAFLLATYGFYRVVRGIAHKFTQENYNPIREGLISIENTLNKNHTKGVPLSYEAQGLIVYWLSKLRSYIPHLNRNCQEQFEQDLAQIGSPEFEIHQKMATIKRMYRTYEFLSFSSATPLHIADRSSFFKLSLNPERRLF
jgi:hypothetical protein